MSVTRKFGLLISLVLTLSGLLIAQDAQSTRAVGAVATIQGTTISLKTDTGAELTVNVADGARVLRMAPGQTDLKTAATIQLSDVQAGDRILVPK